jgi:hypothetical protein
VRRTFYRIVVNYKNLNRKYKRSPIISNAPLILGPSRKERRARTLKKDEKLYLWRIPSCAPIDFKSNPGLAPGSATLKFGKMATCNLF